MYQRATDSLFDDSDLSGRGFDAYSPFRRIGGRYGSPPAGRSPYPAFAHRARCDIFNSDIFQDNDSENRISRRGFDEIEDVFDFWRTISRLLIRVWTNANRSMALAPHLMGMYLGLDDRKLRRFFHSTKTANGPTLGDAPNPPSVLDGKWLYAKKPRAIRRL